MRCHRTLRELDPLSITATAALAAELLDGPVGPGLVRDLYDRTRGYPLFICELLRSATAAQRIRTAAGGHQLAGELEITRVSDASSRSVSGC